MKNYVNIAHLPSSRMGQHLPTDFEPPYGILKQRDLLAPD